MCRCTWRVSYVVGGCNVVATEHGRYDVLYAEECMSNAEIVWHVRVQVTFLYFIATEHGRYGFSFMWKAVEYMRSAECRVDLVVVNKLMSM